jgi:hypothetical protein
MSDFVDAFSSKHTAIYPIRNAPGYWVLNTPIATALVSKHQIGGIFPKRAPFVTGGCWDDIALAALTTSGDRSLLVLGGGVASFAPLARACDSGAYIVCVERNAEIAALGAQLCESSGCQVGEWILASAAELPGNVLAAASVVFVDLYDPAAMASESLQESFHRDIKGCLPEGSLVFVNVSNPPLLAELPETLDSVVRCARMYTSGVLICRSFSTTAVFGHYCTEDELLRKLEQGFARISSVALDYVGDVVSLGSILSSTWDKAYERSLSAVLEEARPDVEGDSLLNYIASLLQSTPWVDTCV